MISWSSSNQSIVTIDDNGIVKAVDIGNATITLTILHMVIHKMIQISIIFLNTYYLIIYELFPNSNLIVLPISSDVPAFGLCDIT